MPTKTKQKQSRDAVPKTGETESEKRFVRDLLIRGEAAKPLPDGELPAGATHKIVENDEEDLPQVERERFSIY
ncbi:MAG: hypothetical protein H0U50_10370 [Pyrinomonadaceae bacterium]|nr:hypothetical protein [Pyrinomonadaceae bacterium]